MKDELHTLENFWEFSCCMIPPKGQGSQFLRCFKSLGLDSGPLEVEHHWLNAGRDFQFIRQHLQDARAAFFLNCMDEVSFKKWRKSNFWALFFWDQKNGSKPMFFLGDDANGDGFCENGGLVRDFLLNIYIAC